MSLIRSIVQFDFSLPSPVCLLSSTAATRGTAQFHVLIYKVWEDGGDLLRQNSTKRNQDYIHIKFGVCLSSWNNLNFRHMKISCNRSLSVERSG